VLDRWVDGSNVERYRRNRSLLADNGWGSIVLVARSAKATADGAKILGEDGSQSDRGKLI
jgi:hypothetical protein